MVKQIINTNRKKDARMIVPSVSLAPTVKEVKVYFEQRGMLEVEAGQFFHYYEEKGWKNRKGEYVINWKGLAYKRIQAILRRQPWRFDKSIH